MEMLGSESKCVDASSCLKVALKVLQSISRDAFTALDDGCMLLVVDSSNESLQTDSKGIASK